LNPFGKRNHSLNKTKRILSIGAYPPQKIKTYTSPLTPLLEERGKRLG